MSIHENYLSKINMSALIRLKIYFSTQSNNGLFYCFPIFKIHAYHQGKQQAKS